MGTGVLVGVGVSVGVGEGVSVKVDIGVFVAELVGVLVAVFVGVLDRVLAGVLVLVGVGSMTPMTSSQERIPRMMRKRISSSAKAHFLFMRFILPYVSITRTRILVQGHHYHRSADNEAGDGTGIVGGLMRTIRMEEIKTSLHILYPRTDSNRQPTL